MGLPDWLNEGKLKTHKTSKSELSQLKEVYARDMTDARVKGLSADRRFAVAYNAALMVAIAALAASGYRAASEGHHYWSIQSLAFTLQLDNQVVNKFNKFRQKRNLSDYDLAGMISEQEVTEMLELASLLQTKLDGWLRENHPELTG